MGKKRSRSLNAIARDIAIENIGKETWNELGKDGRELYTNIWLNGYMEGLTAQRKQDKEMPELIPKR